MGVDSGSAPTLALYPRCAVVAGRVRSLVPRLACHPSSDVVL